VRLKVAPSQNRLRWRELGLALRGSQEHFRRSISTAHRSQPLIPLRDAANAATALYPNRADPFERASMKGREDAPEVSGFLPGPCSDWSPLVFSHQQQRRTKIRTASPWCFLIGVRSSTLRPSRSKLRAHGSEHRRGGLGANGVRDRVRSWRPLPSWSACQPPHRGQYRRSSRSSPGLRW
jgi:hypothetical protein